MDPYQQQSNQPNYNNPRTANASPSDPPNGTAPDQQRQPQYCGGYTKILPNESRRNNLMTTAQREVEQFERLREERRSAPVFTNPSTVGGSVSQEEARERQIQESRRSKLQKQLKKEDEKKRNKEQEELEIQRMKDIQRQKAEKLEQNKAQNELRMKGRHDAERKRVTERFLQKLEAGAPSNRNMGRGEQNVEASPQQRERTTAAPTDKLQSPSNMSRASSSSSSSSESLDRKCSSRPRAPPSSGHSAGEDERGPASGGALEKLRTDFPLHQRDILEDILRQCGGDYHLARAFLSP